MGEWKKYKLKDVCTILGDGLHGTPIYDDKGEFFFINGNNLKDGRISIKNDTKRVPYSEANKYKKPLNNRTILVSINGTIGNVAKYQDEKCILGKSACFFNVKENVDLNFIYYVVANQQFKNTITQLATGTTIKNVSLETMRNYTFCIPPLSIQKQIGKILSSIDDKIELNRRINDNLEQQAQALFNYYFIDTPELLGEFSVGSLADAANYVNGLAMQKYRPITGEKRLPVLKIKELGQGRIDSSSDFCSNEIDSYYKVYDGDVIFSWSGTLMVKIWCGGKCGLNQHLFNVSSKTTPKWFYYFWTKHHLDNFIRIAKDKAVTMGHIKRGELEKAEVLFPNNSVMKKLDTLMAPFLDQIIEKECEIRKLALLRDTLLPKLISGELKINDINN